MIDAVLKVRNGHCPMCARPDAECGARYVVVLRSGEPAAVRRSAAHSAACLACIRGACQDVVSLIDGRSTRK